MIASEDGQQEELLFYGLNIKDAVKKIYKDHKKSLTKGLGECQVQTIDTAVDFTLSLIDLVCELTEDQDYIVLTNDKDCGREYTYDDLKEKRLKEKFQSF